ncbi:MAG: hypothetical protein HYV97_08110 [Bdellovibrio sp.]|nr:hypothetical protein [Bdellovibrio sp.]
MKILQKVLLASVFAFNIQSALATTGQTSSGVLLTDYRTPNNILGEAMIDPSGMIWGDVARNPDGSYQLMNRVEAFNYCAGLKTSVPNEADYRRLRSYMGATLQSNAGYVPQVLPRLTDHWYWTTASSDNGRKVYLFNGLRGNIGFMPFTAESKGVVRCVTTSYFQIIEHPTLGDQSILDPSGRAWGKFTDEVYTNTGTIEDGNLIRSQAINVCTDLGTRLPHTEDFEQLITFFGKNLDTGGLTGEGLNLFKKMFPNIGKRVFWTSTLGMIQKAGFVFNYSRDIAITGDYLRNAHHVWCVQDMP